MSSLLTAPAANIYRRLLGYARPYWPSYTAAIGAMIVYAATDTGFAALMRPLLDGSFRTDARPDARAIMGPGSAGFASIFAAVKHPGTFGKAAAQSYYHGDLKDDLMAAISGGDAQDLELLFHWSSYDYRDPANDFDARADARDVVAALEAKGHRPRILEVDDGVGWGMWQARTGDILEAFFPLK